MEKEKNFDFDPDFSEYNPVLAELSNLKKELSEKENESFLTNLLKKIATPVFIPLD